jgi:hypothetical protein
MSDGSDTKVAFYSPNTHISRHHTHSSRRRCRMLLPDDQNHTGRKPPRRRVRPNAALLLAVLALETQLQAIKVKQEVIDAKLQKLQAAAEAATELLAGVHNHV